MGLLWLLKLMSTAWGRLSPASLTGARENEAAEGMEGIGGMGAESQLRDVEDMSGRLGFSAIVLALLQPRHQRGLPSKHISFKMLVARCAWTAC